MGGLLEVPGTYYRHPLRGHTYTYRAHVRGFLNVPSPKGPKDPNTEYVGFLY